MQLNPRERVIHKLTAQGQTPHMIAGRMMRSQRWVEQVQKIIEYKQKNAASTL